MTRSSGWWVFAVLASCAASAVQGADGPLPPKEAPLHMKLPEGFKATLFAGEPDVVQPIAFAFDDRGRLWVAECYSYPKWHQNPDEGRDRVLIFEDTDGDGRFDKRTVFARNLANLSGIQYGFGGIWLCATPNLLFIPDRNGDDVPDGPPEVVLDGWSLKAQHNVFNSLTWGPDGWLYGCNGIVATSLVGAPSTPEKERTPMNCGVWRYHPIKKKFEAVAHGTTNPWGLDFDEYGEMFITNCVIDHLWHVIPGAHYLRMYGEDLNPHVYKLMPSICDHIHWGGGNWTTSRSPSASKSTEAGYQVHSEAGGGHAHVGCMVYLGDNWPQRYRGGVFMCNLHGNRINHDIFERNGSTYIARHAKDFMFANDPWFRGLALQYGPDGGVYVSDWTDTGECHNYKVVDQTNGRIFKITYGQPKRWTGDLAKLSDEKLAELQLHSNEFLVRHARRLLQERAQGRKISAAAIALLEKQLIDYTDVPLRLHAFWALHASDRLDSARLATILDDPSEHLRAWAVRLAIARPIQPGEELHSALRRCAEREPSPLVRLHLTGSVPRLDAKLGFAIVRELVKHPEQTTDPYLPLMLWYAVESIAGSEHPGNLSALLVHCRVPLVREYLARRLTGMGVDYLLAKDLGDVDDPTFHRDVLRGMSEALGGHKSVRMPTFWDSAYGGLMNSPLAEVRERSLALAVRFGDERALALLRKIVPDRGQPRHQREQALQTLLFQQKADLVPTLHELLHDTELRRQAIRGLAAYDDPQTASLLLVNYRKWSAEERSDVIQTLASRRSYALALLDALEKKTLPRADVNSYTIRQLQSLKAPDVSAAVVKLWGEVRPASADKAKVMAHYKAELPPDRLKKANLSNGRALYQKTCASCHRLFGEGGDIGPDLTGAQRSNLDYILENVIDPSALVPREYQVHVVTTTSGRTLSGIVKKENDAAVTLQTQNEVVVVPKSDIETRVPTKLSMMPEGLFEQLRPDEVRDLIGYLASPMQVPLAKEGGAK
jgi:putative membrane-bound dehydrogenase-like protein